MTLNEQQISQVSAAFKADPEAQAALLRAQPNGAGLKLVVEALRVLGNVDDTVIVQLAVFYGFDPARNPPSRSGATMDDQPVRGSLVSDDNADVSALNANPAIIGALSFPEVFPSRLDAVKEQWIACGQKTLPTVNPAVIRTTASIIGLHLSLGPTVQGGGDRDCPGSSCPLTIRR